MQPCRPGSRLVRSVPIMQPMRKMTPLFASVALFIAACSTGVAGVSSTGAPSPTLAPASSLPVDEVDHSGSGPEWGLGYSEQSRIDFVDTCGRDGVPASFCECWYEEIEATLAFYDFYSQLQGNLVSEELVALSAPCVQPEDREAAIIPDSAFVEAANAACEATALQLATRSDPLPAENVRILVEEFRQLVEELRALPVTDEAQPSVTRWLAVWDNFNDLGEQYADDLAAASNEFVEMGENADALDAVLRAIAHENGMPACGF